MASLGSSSAPGPLYEECLNELQQDMDRLKIKSEEQGKMLQSNIASGDKNWYLINQDLRLLRAEYKEANGGMDDFKEDVYAQFKDVANVTGNFGNRISSLQMAIKKLMEKFDSK